MSDALPMAATLDRDGHVVRSDPLFAAINERAGGAEGEPLAIVAFAGLARIAQRLGIEVTRALTVADGEQDLDCRVTARPDEQGVALSIDLLRERPAWRAPHALLTTPPPPPGAAWTWEADATLRIAAVSEGATGVDAAAAIGVPLSRLFALAADTDAAMPLLEAVARQEDFDDQPATLIATGEAMTLAGSARFDSGGRFAGFIGGCYPASAVPAVAPSAEIGDAFNTRLERILRGPLGRIVANADSIHAAHDGPLDPHYVDYAADIGNAGRHLLGLIDDLVDLEAIERPDFTVEAEPLDLADVARRAAGLLSVRAADAGVTIDRGDAGLVLPATGEFRRALQIMVNLIGNAVRYSPRGSTMWLILQRDGDRAVAIVADQGKGIAVADQSRIFDKFERIDPAEPGGNGLGLYIARRLARAMGGDLTVDSAPGAGARFILSLPAA